MNKYTTVSINYLRPSKTIETILLENNNERRTLYLYNYEGIHFRIFSSLENMIAFFNNNYEPEISFEKEEELEYYLTQVQFETIIC